MKLCALLCLKIVIWGLQAEDGGAFSDSPGETGLQRMEAACVDVCVYVRRPCEATVTCHAWHRSGRAAGGRGKHHLPGTVGNLGGWGGGGLGEQNDCFFLRLYQMKQLKTRSDGSATNNQTAGILCFSSTQPQKKICINTCIQPQISENMLN